MIKQCTILSLLLFCTFSNPQNRVEIHSNTSFQEPSMQALILGGLTSFLIGAASQLLKQDNEIRALTTICGWQVDNIAQRTISEYMSNSSRSYQIIDLSSEENKYNPKQFYYSNYINPLHRTISIILFSIGTLTGAAWSSWHNFKNHQANGKKGDE